MQYKVLSAIKYGGEIHREGSTVEMTKREASKVPAHVLQEVAGDEETTTANQTGHGEETGTGAKAPADESGTPSQPAKPASAAKPDGKAATGAGVKGGAKPK